MHTLNITAAFNILLITRVKPMLPVTGHSQLKEYFHFSKERLYGSGFG